MTLRRLVRFDCRNLADQTDVLSRDGFFTLLRAEEGAQVASFLLQRLAQTVRAVLVGVHGGSSLLDAQVKAQLFPIEEDALYVALRLNRTRLLLLRALQG